MAQGVVLYLSVALGVAVSIILPLVRPLLPKPPEASALGRKRSPSKWQIVKPFFVTGLFSLIVAVLIVAFMGDKINSWQAGFLAGYTADSTLQKITSGSDK